MIGLQLTLDEAWQAKAVGRLGAGLGQHRRQMALDDAVQSGGLRCAASVASEGPPRGAWIARPLTAPSPLAGARH